MMWHLKRAIVIWTITALIAWWGIANGKESSFNLLWNEFEVIEDDGKEFHEIYKIGNVIIHAVSNRKLFSYKSAQDEKNGYAGYTVYDIRKYPIKEIWILAKKVNGEIIFPWAVLGHEICHVLNFENKEIKNPDK